MNKLTYWYNCLTIHNKAKFREHIIDNCGIDESTVYRYLSNEAPKLTKHLIADYTKIQVNELYKPQMP